MKKKKAIFKLLCVLLGIFFFLLSAQIIYAQGYINIPLKDTQNRAILLTQSKQNDNFPLPIESSNKIMLFFTSNSGDLTISLQSPNSNVYTKDNIELINGTFLKFDLTSTSTSNTTLLPISGGVNYIFTINNPPIGLWTVNISANNIQDDIGVFFTYCGTSDLKVALTTNKEQYQLGEPIIIACIVNDGENPFNNASVTALISGPSSSINLSLLDNGTNYDALANDGIFSGSIVASKIGKHKISTKVEGTYQGNNFLKNSSITFYVNEQLAEFTNNFNDYGLDTDNDNLINKIVIEVGVYVYKEGEYDLKITLKSPNGNTLSGHNSVMINTLGNHIFKQEFNAEQILGLNSSGPFMISEVILENISELPIKLAGQVFDAWQTKEYDLTSLQKPDISITSNITESVIDNNSNSLYDILNINMEIDLLYSGFYQWNIKLTDKENKEIETLNGSGNFDSSLNLITLNFDGEKIGQNKIDGPFHLKDLLFWGNEKSLVQNYIYTTQFYQYVDFEGAPQNQPPTADAGPDLEAAVGSDCIANVSLDGSASFDPDGDPLTYAWSWDDGSATGVNPTIQLPLGTHIISLVVNDGTIDSVPDEVEIIVIDTTSPEITLSVSPNTLWPPNHKMVLITPTITANDNCDPNPIIELESITMNEGEETNTYDPAYDDTVGDGHTIDDIQVDDNGNIYLRAERSGAGNGRIYTITYTATDDSGNSSSASATVTVPHDQQ